MTAYVSSTLDELFYRFEGFLNGEDSTSSEDYSLSDDLNSSSPVMFQSNTIVKKKRIRKKKLLVVSPVQKIIKHDIRKSYANMLINVFNCADFYLMYGLLDTFFIPNFVQNFNKSYKDDAFQGKNMSVNGVLGVAQHWFATFILMPDATISLRNTQINYSTGRIVASISLAATKIYDEPCFAYFEKRMAELAVANASLKKEKKDSKSIIESLAESVSDVVSTLQPRLLPIAMEVNGTMTLCTNEDKQMTSMNWELLF